MHNINEALTFKFLNELYLPFIGHLCIYLLIAFAIFTFIGVLYTLFSKSDNLFTSILAISVFSLFIILLILAVIIVSAIIILPIYICTILIQILLIKLLSTIPEIVIALISAVTSIILFSLVVEIFTKIKSKK